MKFVKRYLPKTISGLFKIVLAVVFIFPFLWMVSNSIKTYQETLMFPPKLLPAVPQWQNFKVVWESGPYPTYFKNSLVVVFAIIILQTPTLRSRSSYTSGLCSASMSFPAIPMSAAPLPTYTATSEGFTQKNLIPFSWFSKNSLLLPLLMSGQS